MILTVTSSEGPVYYMMGHQGEVTVNKAYQAVLAIHFRWHRWFLWSGEVPKK